MGTPYLRQARRAVCGCCVGFEHRRLAGYRPGRDERKQQGSDIGAGSPPDGERFRNCNFLGKCAFSNSLTSSGTEGVLKTVTLPPPTFSGGTVSLRFEALSTEGASALLLASVGLSWRFRLFGNQRTDSPVPAAFLPQNGLLALSFSESSGLVPFRPLVEKVSNLLAFSIGRFREGSTLKRGRTGVGRNSEGVIRDRGRALAQYASAS